MMASTSVAAVITTVLGSRLPPTHPATARVPTDAIVADVLARTARRDGTSRSIAGYWTTPSGLIRSGGLVRYRGCSRSLAGTLIDSPGGPETSTLLSRLHGHYSPGYGWRTDPFEQLVTRLA